MGSGKSFSEAFASRAKTMTDCSAFLKHIRRSTLGGGVNVGSGPVGLRLGLDYIRVMKKDDSLILSDDHGNGLNLSGYRFSVGVTFGFGN